MDDNKNGTTSALTERPTTPNPDEYERPTLTENERMYSEIASASCNANEEPIPAETTQPISNSKRDSLGDNDMVHVPLLRQLSHMILHSDAHAQDMELQEKREACIRLLVFPVIGTIFIVLHHFFCSALSHHSALAMAITIGGFTIQPTWALTSMQW